MAAQPGVQPAQPANSLLKTYFENFGSTHELYFFTQEPKSGLTPLATPTEALTPAALGRRQIIRQYQRGHLQKFETKQLIDSNAIQDPNHPISDIGPSDLTFIHPVLSRDNWETDLASHLAFYPLGHDRNGQFWKADNEEVWEALKPCLALVTKFIVNHHLASWWDTITFGETEPIESHRGTNGEELEKILPWEKPPQMTYEALLASRMREWDDLVPGLKFGISSGWCDPENGFVDDEATWQACTNPHFLRKNHMENRVHLAYEKLSPLLFGRLTVGERLVAQFDVAITFFHELAHAMHLRRFQNPVDWDPLEKYYQDESIAELGYSMINAMFGGRDFVAIPAERRGYWHLREISVLGLVFQKGFPTLRDVQSRDDPRLPVLDPWLAKGFGEWDEFLVPLKYISDMQKENFWSQHVATFGVEGLRPQPLQFGVRLTTMHGPRNADEHDASSGSDGNDENGQDIDSISTDLESLAEYIYEDDLEAGDRYASALQALGEEENAYDDDLNIQFDRADIENERFDPNLPPPESFVQVWQILQNDRYALGLHTMVEWTPSNLLFSYINRLRPGAISRENFYDFLQCCQVHQVYFEYSREGNGKVRTIQNGWAPAQPPAKTAVNALQSKPSQKAFNKMIRKYTNDPVYAQNGDLRDMDKDIFFERLMKVWGALTRAQFDQGMKYLDFTNHLFVDGPAGVYRRLPRPGAVRNIVDSGGASGGSGGGGGDGAKVGKKRGAAESFGEDGRSEKRTKSGIATGSGGQQDPLERENEARTTKGKSKKMTLGDLDLGDEGVPPQEPEKGNEEREAEA